MSIDNDVATEPSNQICENQGTRPTIILDLKQSTCMLVEEISQKIRVDISRTFFKPKLYHLKLHATVFFQNYQTVYLIKHIDNRLL